MKIDGFNSNHILKSLKDFQVKSARNAFEILYRDQKTSRFLIADEVGLGKTLICKGILALAIEQLLEKFKGADKTIDIIYICSNLDIAGQNIRRLNFIDNTESHASRITLIPELYAYEKNKEAKGKVRFISFTPGTSFDLKHANGWKRERALIFYLLRQAWDLNDAKSQNFFRATAGKSRWYSYLNDKVDEWSNLDFEPFQSEFIKRLKKYPSIQKEYNYLKSYYPQDRSDPGTKINSERSHLIGRLREILAETCLQMMDPDIVILDEFQRFKSLLDENTEVGGLAAKLFQFKDVKTILLSATPYKMYTIRGEDEEDHYEDFLRTTSWLLDDKGKLDGLKELLEKYRHSIFRNTQIDWDKALRYKIQVEAILKTVMSRTERINSTLKQDGMIRNISLTESPQSTELISFVELERIAKALETKGNVEYRNFSGLLTSEPDL